MAYSDIVPVGTGLVIAAASFGLGAAWGNLPYDIDTLWRQAPGGFEASLVHYAKWSEAPKKVHYILHFVIALGLIGSFIKLYKPHEDAKYFEYGSLFMLTAGIVVYLTNLRIGSQSCVSGQWGEVDRNTGINVIAASQVILILALTGVLVLQGGLYYAEWYDRKLKEEFYKQEADAQKKRQEAPPSKVETETETETETAKSTGTKSTGTKAKETKAKSRK